MEEWLPVLGDLARLDVAENRLTRGLDPKMRQTRRFELIEQLLLHVASETPVLALFEDLHWADPISLELWQRVAAALDGHPVLLVGVQRTGLDLAVQQDTHVAPARVIGSRKQRDDCGARGRCRTARCYLATDYHARRGQPTVLE